MKKSKSKLGALLSSLKPQGFVEYAIAAMFLVALTMLGTATYSKLTAVNELELTKASVKILRNDGRSGGSGTIIESNASNSIILTNAHVCKVVENGGYVESDTQSHAVTKYWVSYFHDLCLIEVAANMGVNTKIAANEPAMYSAATIVGHPHLNPTTITRGNFSGRSIIEVMTGVRKCTQDDIDADPDNALLCFFLGGIPTLTRYETQLVTANISPGSSGSPVFNDRGELAAVVFAGSGDVSNAYVVPFGAVKNFMIGNDMPDFMIPNNTFEINAQTLKGGRKMEFEALTDKLDKMCDAPEAKASQTVKHICDIHQRDMMWRK